MSFKMRPIVLGLAVATAPLAGTAVHAGATIKVDDTKWVSVGAGLRTSFVSMDEGAPNGKDRSKDFLVENMRLYVNGQIHQNVKLEFNSERSTDSDGDENIRVLDAVAKFEFSDTVNIWMGRFLPPSDRSNLDGPYYLNTWSFPMPQAYPAIFAGRDNGVAFWGRINGGQFKYQLGAFEGVDGAPTINPNHIPNPQDNLLYAARFTANFWDPEPGYYNNSTYYGAQDVLALGLVYQTQGDAAMVNNNTVDFTGWSVDGLLEKKLAGGGVVNLEFTYYDYEGNPVLGGNDATGYFTVASYLLAGETGIGRLQPIARYQNLDVDRGSETTTWEVGINYVIDGHNARVSAVYSNMETDPPAGSSTDRDQFLVGLQLQI